MTPYVTNGPQIDNPDGQNAQEFSLGMDNSVIHMFDGVLYLGVEKDVSWMSIPAGTNTRKHGWRDVVSSMDQIRIPNLLSIYKQVNLLVLMPLQVWDKLVHFDWA